MPHAVSNWNDLTESLMSGGGIDVDWVTQRGVKKTQLTQNGLSVTISPDPAICHFPSPLRSGRVCMCGW